MQFEPYDEDERILEILVESKKDNMDSNMLTLKMLTEFCFDKTSGKKLMSFDDFQYNNMNTKILNQYVDKTEAHEGYGTSSEDSNASSPGTKKIKPNNKKLT